MLHKVNFFVHRDCSKCIDAHTYTHTHARTHAHTHTHTHTHTHITYQIKSTFYQKRINSTLAKEVGKQSNAVFGQMK